MIYIDESITFACVCIIIAVTTSINIEINNDENHFYLLTFEVNKIRIVQNKIFNNKNTLGSDVKFLKRYFRYFSHLVIFPPSLKQTSSRVQLF